MKKRIFSLILSFILGTAVLLPGGVFAAQLKSEGPDEEIMPESGESVFVKEDGL